MPPDLTALIAALRSHDSAAQLSAAEKLAQLGPDAKGAAMALVEACDADDDAREWIVAALEDLGPPLPSDIAQLTPLLVHPSLDVAYWAATLLGRLEAEAAPAVGALATAASSHAELAVRQRAVWALGRIGPAAATALAVLHTAAESTDPRLSALAHEAIKRVSS